jgi:cell division protease FtsH
MSEEPPKSDKPPGGPHDSKKSPGDGSGVNWRLSILLSLGLLVLALALFGPSMNQTVRTLSYSEFRQAWDEGRVITTDQEKLPFRVVTADATQDATIEGYLKPRLLKEKDSEQPPAAFIVPINPALEGDDVRAILGEQLKTETLDDAAWNELANSGAASITLAEFRRSFALGEVLADLGNPLRVVTQASGNGAMITGTRAIATWKPKKTKAGEEIAPEAFQVPVNILILGDELAKFQQTGASYKRNVDYLKGALFTFLPFLLIILLLFFLFRHQMKSAGRGAMSFGKSKARLLTMDRNKITFKDVAGIQEAKEELFEIVDFLRDPRKFQKLGGNIPKGVLMVGPPGTGKTLLARAIAGEADVPFFSISGSDFVEMFVGVGASRVRDMFEQGKKNAPCLIFIDEIDAVGRHRGHGMGGGHDEREQTLNQLLVEMDGFDTQEGVIIIAATNRPDVLDPALLRPGRFDRQVTVSLPDVNGREEILRVHVKKIKLAAGVDLGVIARGTPGFSGAELANLINEAALLAARKGQASVVLADMEEARDKVRWGRERRSLAMSEKERVGTAWHEAGHAYLNVVLPHTHPLHKVTIIPRGPYLGATMYLPDGDKYSTQKKEALANLIVTMGGRIAEAFHSDDVSNGASGDIRQATSLARHMVCEWGMSDKLGMVEYGEGDSPVFLARDMAKSRNYSEETARVIDAEIKRFIDEAYQTAEKILTDNRHTIELIAKALLEYETLDAQHIRDLIDHGEMRNPPSLPKPPPVPEELRSKPARKKAEGDQPEDDGPLPGAVGAPA